MAVTNNEGQLYEKTGFKLGFDEEIYTQYFWVCERNKVKVMQFQVEEINL